MEAETASEDLLEEEESLVGEGQIEECLLMVMEKGLSQGNCGTSQHVKKTEKCD